LLSERRKNSIFEYVNVRALAPPAASPHFARELGFVSIWFNLTEKRLFIEFCQFFLGMLSNSANLLLVSKELQSMETKAKLNSAMKVWVVEIQLIF
jgi:hypothetical protein